jgi:hypothetical protein
MDEFWADVTKIGAVSESRGASEVSEMSGS